MAVQLTIWITLEERRIKVSKKQYIELKTKDLVRYGYVTLTEAAVSQELEGILKDKQWESVIGGFIAGDLPSSSPEEPEINQKNSVPTVQKNNKANKNRRPANHKRKR